MLPLRERDAATSAVSAMRFGIAPPRPSPVSNRMPDSDCMFPARVVRSENSPKAASEPTSTGLRPIRSAIRPPATAPSKSPAPLAAKTMPNQNGEAPNAARIPAAATPAACTSKPSHIAARKQRDTVTRARRVLGIAGRLSDIPRERRFLALFFHLLTLNDGASSDTFIVPRNSDLDHSVRSTYPSAAYISDQPR